jgi:SAM-dependent methyltransferase
MKWFRDNFFKENDNETSIIVLDAGSQCVPGQSATYKIYFNKEPFKYIGLDMVEGYNVDITLKNPYQWEEISDNFCDVLISGQVFEHIEFPWFTISEIARVVKPNGLICIIVPSMQGLHRFPVNCQNYFSDGMIALAKYAGLETVHASTNYAPQNAAVEWYSGAQDTMLIARKPESWKPNNFSIVNYICEPADLVKTATGFISIEEQNWYKIYKLKNRIKKYIKAVFWPIVYVRRAIIKNKRRTANVVEKTA